MRLEDRKGYLTLAVTSKQVSLSIIVVVVIVVTSKKTFPSTFSSCNAPSQGRMLLRRTEGISEWGRVVEQAVAASRGRFDSIFYFFNISSIFSASRGR